MVDSKEYIDAICGDLSDYRRDRIELAWWRINPTLAPNVFYVDIRSQFNSVRHPSVRLGERTEQDIIEEFEQTFLTYHAVLNNGDETAFVSKDEFFDYFRILSITYPID
mgnify:FL=1